MKSARTLGHSLRLIATLSRFVPPAALMWTVAVPLVASTTLVGCIEDEADPQTWVKRLGDKSQRNAAIKKLHDEFFQKTLSKAGNDRTKPEVKAMLDIIAEPMTKTYIELAAGGPEVEPQRKELMKYLSDFRDKRCAPAMVQAMASYEQGKNEEEVNGAVQGAMALAKSGKENLDEKLITTLWDKVFLGFKASKGTLKSFLLDLHEAILEVAKATKDTNPYGDKALEKLRGEMKVILPGMTEEKKASKDEEFWQTTAVQVISEVRYTKAVKDLLIVMLTPGKQSSEIYGPARTALLKMPKEAEPVLISALNGSDPVLKKLIEVGKVEKDGKPLLYKEETKELDKDGKPVLGKNGQPIIHAKGTQVPDTEKTGNNLSVCSESLSLISRPAGRDAVLTALSTADSNLLRTAYATALVSMPAESDAIAKKMVAAFLDAYKKADKDYRPDFLSLAAALYDPSLVPWLLGEAVTADKDAKTRVLAVDGAIRLMKPDQVGQVTEGVNKTVDAIKKFFDEKHADVKKELKDKEPAKLKEREAGLDKEFAELSKLFKDSLEFAKDTLSKCPTGDPICFAKLLDAPIPSSPPNANMRAIKATYMAVIYGTGEKAAAVRAELAQRLDKTTNRNAREQLAVAVDELSPQGDLAIADKFEKTVADDKGTGNPELMKADDAVAKVALRLRGRAAN